MKRCLKHAGLLVLIPMAAAMAQTQAKTIMGMSGNLFRYHGDTIWLERDSTMTRAVTHGDTVEHVTSINDQPLAELTYVVHGDTAVIVKAVNARGPVPTGTIGRAVPAPMAMFVNKMLETELKAGDNPLAQLIAPPTSPESPKAYVLSPAIRLVQHRDTVAYIRGCDGTRADTTKFLMFGTDSVRRVSQPERTFGPAMALSLTTQMRVSLMKEIAAGRETPLTSDPQKGPAVCSGQR
jgi:hypothetical protein